MRQTYSSEKNSLLAVSITICPIKLVQKTMVDGWAVDMESYMSKSEGSTKGVGGQMTY